MAAEAPVPPEPPRPPETSYGPFLWVAAAVGALLLILAIMRRRTGPPEPVGPSHPPEEPDAEPLPIAFSPPAPVVVDEPPAEPEAEAEPVLPRIPRTSTEWQEGDDLEGVVEPEDPLRSVDELVAALRTGDPSVCDAAVRDLVKHGRAAVPALERALSDDDPDLRVDAARALTAIRGDAGG